MRNAARFLPETLDSILRQSFKDWEIVFVDDHSEDSSYEILQTLSHKNPRVQVYKNTGNGIIEALKLALSKVSGKYVTRMDADDIMPADRLSRMKSTLDQLPKKSIVTGDARYFSESAVSQGYQKYERWLNQINQESRQWENIYRECVVASPNWMMRTDELKMIKGFDGLQYPEDYDLVFRWYENKFTIHHIPETTLLWREHPDRTSRNSVYYNQQHFFKLKISRFIALNWNGKPVILWGRNQKTRLCEKYLSSFNVSYKILQLENHEEFMNYPQSQLLVTVFPSQKERSLIENYLRKENRIEGKNWWYV